MTIIRCPGKGIDVCTLFEEIAKENRAKGRAEGKVEGRAEGRVEGRAESIIEIGFDLGLSEKEILMLQKKLNLSSESAQEYIKMFGTQTV